MGRPKNERLGLCRDFRGGLDGIGWVGGIGAKGGEEEEMIWSSLPSNCPNCGYPVEYSHEAEVDGFWCCPICGWTMDFREYGGGE